MSVVNTYDIQVQPFKDDHGKWQLTRADKPTRYAYFEADKANHINIDEKERRTIDLLKMALSRVKKPVVSCSFGIDSVLTIYLVRKALIELGCDPSDIGIIWNDTVNEFPEVRKYAEQLTSDWSLRLVITKPKKSLKRIIDDNGGISSDYFTARKGNRRNGQPLSEKCCGTLKHEPMKRAIKEHKWDLVINGLRADESRQRLLAGLRDGEFFYSIAEWKSLVARPILWWNEEDVWDYVEKEDIPYNDLYRKNLIQKYPDDLGKIIAEHELAIVAVGLDIDSLRDRQTQTVTRRQAIFLDKIGFKMFTPRTGCMMCPIPVKYGYMQWMRLYYPKVYSAMVHNLGYGKVLIEMIPEEIREEIKEFTGIDVTAENAHEHLREILEAKPCTFDSFE
ncbi:phosphoadenosine phosphosulfate reductase family protein [Bacillus cereus]|uniref:phosphoadenosine phosphosulfate reductase family protein n=1 Tax=Bacillus cereus TaxID=1396 RepID=UPI000B4ADC06|nr:phosphoadenosine phosphosulfate reductase family protein [Bacillus cereus]